jgi:hypothetical protein
MAVAAWTVTRGGYGYIINIDGMVVGVTKKRVKIRVLKNDGSFKFVYVSPGKLKAF